MSLSRRDLVATVAVAVAGFLYWLWVADVSPPGLESARATGLVMLALGFAASASAVVPGFDQLVHGNKAYLAITSAIGLIAVVAGVQLLVTSSEAGLAVLMGAMGALWLIATIHHVMLAEPAAPRRAHSPGPRAHAS